MNFISMLAALIGFAPPVALMFISLRNYTYPKVEKPYFSDPTFFGMFAVGSVDHHPWVFLLGICLRRISEINYSKPAPLPA